IGTALTGPLEGIRNPIPTRAAITADTIFVSRRGVRRRLIHDINDLRLGVTLTESLHPGLDRRLAVAGVHPPRLLRAPHKTVLFEDDVVVVRILVNGVE